MSKRYTSFEQIDKDLKIMRLKQEIAVENLKLSYTEARKSLYPTQLLGGVTGIIQKLAISLLAKKLLQKFSR
ncbi:MULTISPECIES: DUF6327 family protein [Robiginitalea]|uniref:Glutaminyl-tRNA synthetase n=1 Tax=Robiginitalea biformata (strain ATCC BAA-864 / DSM 15991 / KCTC 12146 / HTCC2501) TaxID=313596 RepID=A4CI38_ROBBH|nr:MULTISPECIES: DUF6327 family protein [Robiginitalea]EAR16596.1 glutaminyl-tRNA synthetase [Robiginitalea biformata HTCC2501]MDC6353168.1 DUF6327 family protein [Robiginitalea sp. PM2]MDC6373665.1 DUF6327 family protein [Robiginitalea sp. SP8]